MTRSPAKPKKKHHYVPVTYLSRFTDTRGRVWTYPKDETGVSRDLLPRETAAQNYYYAQPMADGGRDTNTLEDLFGEVETPWDTIVETLESRGDIAAMAESLFAFMGLLRVRGPAMRDAIELDLAEKVRMTARQMQRSGQLPALVGAAALIEQMVVSIDPHQSLLAMPPLMQGFAGVLERIGLEVVHNHTAEGFITSDNPVIYFDPTVEAASLRPYAVPPGASIELLMPISPRTLLRGSSDLIPPKPGQDLAHIDMTRDGDVQRINHMMARFAYRLAFADRPGLETLVAEHAQTSPTLRTTTFSTDATGQVQFTQFLFAPRPVKPRWSGA